MSSIFTKSNNFNVFIIEVIAVNLILLLSTVAFVYFVFEHPTHCDNFGILNYDN
jgi:hypothetical protein